MDLDEVINRINDCADQLDYVSARKYIEENMSLLERKKHFLNSNAREILNFLIEQSQLGIEPLSKKELAMINAVNVYAYQFNLRGIKIMVKENTPLFLRKDTIAFLNDDAKTILTGMGVIKN